MLENWQNNFQKLKIKYKTLSKNANTGILNEKWPELIKEFKHRSYVYFFLRGG